MAPETSFQISNRIPDSLLDNLNPEDYELPEEEQVKSLSPKRKPAGKPKIKSDTARPKSSGSGDRVVVPGLGQVTLVIH